jgi:hypothetical protein
MADEQTDAAAFDRELFASRDRLIANLRAAGDHRRAEHLAKNIYAMLQGESQANAMLALTRLLGVWLRSVPHEEQVTGVAVITSLVTQQILGRD